MDYAVRHHVEGVNLSEAVDSHDRFDQTSYPVEKAVLTKAPEVPPPITRKHPVRLQVDMTSTVKVMNSSLDTKYEYWTFNDIVPGPFIRARVGDVLEVTFTNLDSNGLGHNIDFHAVTGPGGGAPATYAEEGQTRTAAFKLLYPGLWVYHCAAEPVPVHIANGMYGCILVEPEEGMAPADKEFYVMQSELYATPSDDNPRMLEFDYAAGLDEKPKFVVFNGRVGALTENPLKANAGDRVRVYFGNAGPDRHPHGHRSGRGCAVPGRGIHTTTVGPGAASIIELDVPVPGNYALVDHAIFRLDKGCVGFLKVVGDDERKDIYDSRQPQINCAGCKLHS
ncbi:Cupredoxin [Gaertneriomyces semiglobifer]|nr:Cupredoxin [Gaertneriomyces semiglobifer]